MDVVTAGRRSGEGGEPCTALTMGLQPRVRSVESSSVSLTLEDDRLTSALAQLGKLIVKMPGLSFRKSAYSRLLVCPNCRRLTSPDKSA